MSSGDFYRHLAETIVTEWCDGLKAKGMLNGELAFRDELETIIAESLEHFDKKKEVS